MILLQITIGAFIVALIAKWADSMLDYGKLLGSIRYKIALRHAERVNKKEWFLTEAGKAKKMDFAGRLDAMNTLYWQTAKDSFWLTGWICINCMGSRIVSLIAWGILLFQLSENFAFESLILPAAIAVIGGALTEFFINLTSKHGL